MFADSITLTLFSTDDTVLAKTSDGFYRKADATHEVLMAIRQSKTTPKNSTGSQNTILRHNIELVRNVWAAGDVPEHQVKAYGVLMAPAFSIYAGNVLATLAQFLLASNAAAITKLRNGEV